jgi:DNA-binding transcriptional ArsR family regulator
MASNRSKHDRNMGDWRPQMPMDDRLDTRTKFTIEASGTLLPAPDQVHYLGIFEALCEPLRMEIVRQIANAHELACTTLDETLPISKPTISYHIKILSQAQLISVRKEGRHYHYRLRREVFDYFLPTFLDRLLGALPSMATASRKESAASIDGVPVQAPAQDTVRLAVR